jgi:hypothetical protein
MHDELSQVEIWFATNELTNVLGLNPFIDLNVLHRQGLVSAYATMNHIVGDKTLPYTKAQPTTFGVLLFAAALNSLPTWSQFGHCAFIGSKEIRVPAIFASSLAELSALVGLTKEPMPQDGESSE